MITSDPKERTTLSSYKFIGAFGGGLLIQFFTLPLVERFGGGDEAVGFQHTMMLYAAVAVVLFLIIFLVTRERVKPPVAQKTPIRGAATMYYFIYYVEDKSLVKWFFTAGTLAVIVGILLVDRIARRYGKKKTYMWLMISTSCSRYRFISLALNKLYGCLCCRSWAVSPWVRLRPWCGPCMLM